MSISLAPTTLLDAVNECLAAIGEAPVNTLTNPMLGDAATALSRLRDASRRTQQKGWSWNTDYGMSLAVAGDGTIPIPTNTLKFTPMGKSDRKNLVTRGNKLYDANHHTYTFTAPVTGDLVTMIDFELLPEIARQFIFLTAVVRFQAGYIGSEILDKYTTRDIAQAWSELLSAELEIADWNILRDSAYMVSALNRVTVGNVGFPDSPIGLFP